MAPRLKAAHPPARKQADVQHEEPMHILTCPRMPSETKRETCCMQIQKPIDILPGCQSSRIGPDILQPIVVDEGLVKAVIPDCPMVDTPLSTSQIQMKMQSHPLHLSAEPTTDMDSTDVSNQVLVIVSEDKEEIPHEVNTTELGKMKQYQMTTGCVTQDQCGFANSHIEPIDKVQYSEGNQPLEENSHLFLQQESVGDTELDSESCADSKQTEDQEVNAVDSYSQSNTTGDVSDTAQEEKSDELCLVRSTDRLEASPRCGRDV